MKYIASLTCLLLITVATPALALQGSDCSARAEKLQPSERKEFMKSCLEKAQDPANIKEEERKQKIARCEQNARNKKLQGNEKANYHAECMNKNEAESLAKAQPGKTVSLAHKPASSSKPKSTPPHKTVKKQKSHGKKAKKSAKPAAAPAKESEGQ
ncbi:PsiF family protein [Sideroxydans lithotrophicus]|uniref:PsiF repeat protein n=1 Tax=Sideroxydans lithotrophicus (strain ES-1) TaxID=580332 RepID=D5CM33_SIDLE|nr:PsiF family protein [Sideroxydans lithotrophicus]ADE10647.1 hypothetical protein Slit_0406 [Sideroxydans lithotrophicus ES-1]